MKRSKKQAKRDHKLLVAIQRLMDGVEWSPQTLDEIAVLLDGNGYKIRDIPILSWGNGDDQGL
jgi:hypothetical protein